MMSGILRDLAILVALAFMSGLLAGAETAILCLRKGRVADLLDERRRGARAVHTLREQPERLLATVRVFITAATATAAALAGRDAASDLAVPLRGVGLGRAADGVALVLIVLVVTCLALVIGDLIPRSLAMRASEKTALFFARPLLLLSWLLKPIVWALTGISNLFLRLFGDRTTFSEARLDPEEIQQLVEEASESGTLDPRVGDIAARALDLTTLRVGAVMLPRGRIVAVRRHAPTDEVLALVAEHGHSRIPVYEGTIDRIVGYVVAKDVITLSVERQLLVLEDILRPCYFVSEATMVVDVLREMQKRRTQLAIVLDEHAAVAGLVTTEDLLEELVGDILAEHEKPEDEISREADGAAVVRGSTPIREVNRALDVDLPESPTSSTVAGLCIHLAGWIPQAGARLTAGDGTVIDVLDATPRTVEKVRIRPRAARESG